MIYYNLFNKEDMLEFHFGGVGKLIQDLKKQYLAKGGNPKDFPEYLKECGAETIGSAIKISDEFALMAKLKFS